MPEAIRVCTGRRVLAARGFWEFAALAGWLPQGHVGLDLVAVAAAVFLVDGVAGCGQVGDDAVGAAFGDARAGRGVAQPVARVVGDAQQHPGVVGQEAPALYTSKTTANSRN
jgi:hypothetical protein